MQDAADSEMLRSDLKVIPVHDWCMFVKLIAFKLKKIGFFLVCARFHTPVIKMPGQMQTTHIWRSFSFIPRYTCNNFQ